MKTIAVVGLSDEDAAHLRLLVRKAESSLKMPWRWGTESEADLVVVDPASFAGLMARSRARVQGIRCALLDGGNGVPEGEDPVLHKPLKLDALVALLHQVAAQSQPSPVVAPRHQDFYFGDLGDTPTDSALPAPLAAAAPPAFQSGLDELLRVHPEADPAPRPPAGRLDQDTSIAPAARPRDAGPVGPAQKDPDALRSRLRDRQVTAAQGAPSTRSADDARTHGLSEYLTGSVLAGPSAIALPDAPELIVDPRSQVFHASGSLRDLEPYCRQPLRRGDWRPLTSAGLARLQAAGAGQPVQRLLWLCALLGSDGRLAPHLDPGGTYLLKRWLEIDRGYARQFRIASVMVQPQRIHDIARASDAAMGEVFDTINAFDAIGYLQWTPRSPRHADENGGAFAALMRRLRKPIGRS
ncbi:hypothetical protein [Dokdonella koreensis]|uniref:Uncharacterized protein n=1 Tax=Dokdonella koreensis DS-123 TaxID=1300342 RepID=A0A167H3W2_9GAMM|nr:hypothetical protein [Dokdonella koreensis]ANB18782.1 Hypothetical protein I596_2787 [Dokdonella koreensis DS-123]